MAVPFAQSKDGQVEVGTPESLFETRLVYGANINGSKPQYAVGRDGRFLLNARVDEARPSPITVVLNGLDRLRK